MNYKETMNTQGFQVITEEELLQIEGGFAITATGVIGTLIVGGFGGLGVYLGLK